MIHGNTAVLFRLPLRDAFVGTVVGVAVSLDFDIQNLISFWYVFGSWKIHFLLRFDCRNRPRISLDLETETVMVRSLMSFSTACDKGTTKL